MERARENFIASERGNVYIAQWFSETAAWLAARKFLKYYIINMARNCISNIYSIDMKDERTFFKLMTLWLDFGLTHFWLSYFVYIFMQRPRYDFFGGPALINHCNNALFYEIKVFYICSISFWGGGGGKPPRPPVSDPLFSCRQNLQCV